MGDRHPDPIDKNVEDLDVIISNLPLEYVINTFPSYENTISILTLYNFNFDKIRYAK